MEQQNETQPRRRRPMDPARSTATWAQQLRVLVELRKGDCNTYQLRQRGISHPAGRVRELNHRGYLITKALITTVDADGYTHSGVALYSLVYEPEGAHDE